MQLNKLKKIIYLMNNITLKYGIIQLIYLVLNAHLLKTESHHKENHASK